jgi:hypothetical protein
MQLPSTSNTQGSPVEGKALLLLWLVIICKWIKQFVACSKQQLLMSAASRQPCCTPKPRQRAWNNPRE